MSRWIWIGVFIAVFLTSSQGNECQFYDYSGTFHSLKNKERYLSKTGGFSVDIPKGWPRNFEHFPYQSDESDVFGVEVKGPDEVHGVALKMVFAYYKNGGIARDYRGYLSLRTNSFVRTDPTKEVVLKPIDVNGKKGITFEMETFDLVHEKSLGGIANPEPGIMYKMGYNPSERMVPSVQVIIWNKDIVIPLKGGFFVAQFKIPKELLSECGGIVDDMLATLRFDE